MSNSQVEIINQEINRELANGDVRRALLATTFKGLDEITMRRAILEGHLRGFKFQDFLKKNVYAIPFSGGYSLITSIDYARKVGMRSGVVGKTAPQYEMDGKKVVSCTVTIKRRVGQDIGEYTASVFFDEFDTGKNLWLSKPRTMIAKVAEMHALRMACPEELSQMYTEEELETENGSVEPRMQPYTVARVIPPEEDEGQGKRTQNIETQEAPRYDEQAFLNHSSPQNSRFQKTQEAPLMSDEASYEVVRTISHEGIAQTIQPTEKELKEMKMEIGKLLKEKANFTALGKSQQVIGDKIFDLVGCTYAEENYQFIVDELKNL